MINETLEADRAYQRDKDDAYNRGYKQGKEDAKPHWIPVRERLPKIGNDVLTCDWYDDIKILSLKTGDYGMFYWEDGWGDTEALSDIKVWMPLPEPARG